MVPKRQTALVEETIKKKRKDGKVETYQHYIPL